MTFKATNVLRLTNTVRLNVQEKRLFNSYHSLLLTFSGGQDSAFCLLILYLLQNETRFKQGSGYKAIFSKTKLIQACAPGFVQVLVNIYNKFYKYCPPKIRYRRQDSILQLQLQLQEARKFCVSGAFSQGVDNYYIILWCNHFWQEDSFFTMEHVSKVSFCFCCTTHFFVPISKILSEQNARDWRHKVMQRCLTSAFYKNQNKTLLFLRQIKFKYANQAYFSGSSLTRYEQLCVQGHNKSDRAEAILFNLIRGAGMNGMSTLQWKRAFLLNSNHKFYPVFFGFFKKNVDYTFKPVLFCRAKQIPITFP